ncbi:hypothetical protein Vadar_010427 [Vaccinium darrowii]|uniref:Uncharacterized protein n=1 Tax=Vaccinium darrowii TaxID=229202 RepID=A0ACB7Z4A3_9ERIC|nr:hypothetical protein Vadar_010427 [Vaccinium darrowii]
MAKSCSDLPDECWELIFDRLHKLHHSLLVSPSLTCKRFLSITNTLRTHLTIVHPTTFPISTLFNRFPNLDSVYLRFFCSEDLNRVITDITTSNLNLKTLDFTGTDGLPLESWRLIGSRMNNLRVLICLGLEKLRDIELVVIADSMPCLEELDISYPVNDFGSDHDELEGRSPGEVGVTDSGIEVLSSKLRCLRKINLTGNEFLTDKSLIALSTNCVYLTEMVVLNCSVTEYGIEFVMSNSTKLSVLSVDEIDFDLLDDCSIRCARNISSLAIYNSKVPDEYLNLLVKADIPLKSFTLSYCMCSQFIFSGISSLLDKYRSLESLDLDGINLLTDENMSSLSQCLSALVTISLDCCDNLTESTFFKLAKECPLLEDISMGGTNLGRGGDTAIDVVKNPRIKSLNLENNSNLSDECLAKLALVCPNLEALVVTSCKGITEKGIADFLKSSSNVRKLRIDECGGIKNIGSGFELLKLDFIGATRSGINDDGLVVIGNRCRGLLNLNLDGCFGVTIVGLKEILKNCERLRKINLTGCLNVSKEVVDWMVFTRPSLREIILSHSSLPSESQRELFLRHGCLVSSE